MSQVEPRRSGRLDRGGVRIYYEDHGIGDRAMLFLPSWAVVDSRIWRNQIPHLSRHFRVITFDPRGHGRSDRPRGREHYANDCYIEDARAVLDATGVASAVVVGLSRGTAWAAGFGARYPERTAGLVLIGGSTPDHPSWPGVATRSFLEVLDTEEGWARLNAHYLRRDYRGFVEFFARKVFTEPYSSRAIEETVAWCLETTAEVVEETVLGAKVRAPDQDPMAPYRSLDCPVLLLHGDRDAVAPLAAGERLAEVTGGTLITLAGSGHAPQARDPVLVNRLIHEFAERSLPVGAPRRRTVARGPGRRRRVLFLSSPIGLGHARRDLAIARELRRLRPDSHIDWLAQSPVTAVLETAGEDIHPASRHLLSESGYLERESGEHELNVFQAFRNMDQIMVANFMTFQETVDEGQYDLVVGDEAWEVDRFWHDHPELKRCAFAWLTDFVGVLPVPDADDEERAIVADFNAEMLERTARYPRVRDLSIFVGEPEDIIPERFGPGLPEIRAWTEERHQFPGYIADIDPAGVGDRAALRAELGFRPQDLVCIAAVGGSSVGRPLLRRLIDALPAIRARLPNFRMVAIAGPRIDPNDLRPRPGLEIRSYVHDLYRYFAAADLALVQGGLSSTMELTAARRPFIYFPIRRHFEQLHHVRYRLQRYRAGRLMDYTEATPDALAERITGEIARPVDYRHVSPGAAERAARWISELL